MYYSSYIIKEPLNPTLTLKFDLGGSFVKFDPSQNRILYGMKMQNQSQNRFAHRYRADGFDSLPVNTRQKTENAKRARVVTPLNTRLFF